MEIQKNTSAAVVVSAEWRHIGGVARFLGPSDTPGAKPGQGSVLEARILDADDARGLWIETNTERKKWPTYPSLKVLIPWKFIISVILNPELETPEIRPVGFSHRKPERE